MQYLIYHNIMTGTISKTKEQLKVCQNLPNTGIGGWNETTMGKVCLGTGSSHELVNIYM